MMDVITCVASIGSEQRVLEGYNSSYPHRHKLVDYLIRSVACQLRSAMKYPKTAREEHMLLFY